MDVTGRHPDARSPRTFGVGIPPDFVFRCEVEPERDCVRVRPVGELDMATAPEVADRMQELHDAGFRRFVVDLRETTFLDSSGIRLLLRWDAALRGDGGDLALVPGPPGVRRVFDVAGMSEQFRFIPEI